MIETDNDTAAADNVHPFPGATPEPQPRPTVRSKDRRAAARQARKRSKIKADRDAQAIQDVSLVPHVGAPVTVPTVTPNVTRSGVVNAPRAARVLPLPPGADVHVPAERHHIDRLTLLAALALASVSAGYAIYGMTSIFVGAFWPVVGMGLALELGKLRAVTWIGRNASTPWWGLKGALTVLVLVLMGLNVIGAFGSWRKPKSATRWKERPR